MHDFASPGPGDRQFCLGITAAKTKAGHVGQIVLLGDGDPAIAWEGEPQNTAGDAYFDARQILGHAVEQLFAAAQADLDAPQEEVESDARDTATC